MDVHIQEIQATVHAVDGESVLSPQTLETIVRVVLRAVREDREHQERVRAEQRVSRGVYAEQEEGD